MNGVGRRVRVFGALFRFILAPIKRIELSFGVPGFMGMRIATMRIPFGHARNLHPMIYTLLTNGTSPLLYTVILSLIQAPGFCNNYFKTEPGAVATGSTRLPAHPVATAPGSVPYYFPLYTLCF